MEAKSAWKVTSCEPMRGPRHSEQSSCRQRGHAPVQRSVGPRRARRAWCVARGSAGRAGREAPRAWPIRHGQQTLRGFPPLKSARRCDSVPMMVDTPCHGILGGRGARPSGGPTAVTPSTVSGRPTGTSSRRPGSDQTSPSEVLPSIRGMDQARLDPLPDDSVAGCELATRSVGCHV